MSPSLGPPASLPDSSFSESPARFCVSSVRWKVVEQFMFFVFGNACQWTMGNWCVSTTLTSANRAMVIVVSAPHRLPTKPRRDARQPARFTNRPNGTTER
eukprot:3442973-Rhodomonas_salina.1